MTSDKENGNAVNELQNTGQSRDMETGSPMLEGERVAMSEQDRTKRKGSHENRLTGINETSERKGNTKVTTKNVDHTIRNDEERLQLPSDTTDKFGNGRELLKNIPNKNLNEASTGTEKGVQTRDHDEVSVGKISQNTSLRSSGSGLRNSEMTSSKSNSGRNFNPAKFVRETSSEISERLKKLSDEYHSESKYSRGIKNHSSSHTGSSSHENSVKLPDVKCKHLAASKATDQNTTLKKRLKVNAHDKENPDKCMICEITEATANYASVEANRLLLEVVYPHEFYDRYQRSGKRAKGELNPKFPENSKMPISICKPVKVASKVLHRERSSFSLKPSAAVNLGIPNSSKNDQNEASDNEQSPQKRIRTDRENTFKKEIHLQCKAKRNALVITDDSEGQKLILKGLKGWMAKKEDACKNTVHKEIKQSLYQVNSLGIQFSIPGYTSSRSDKHQTPRPFTCLDTPRPIDMQQAQRRPGTDNYSHQKSLDESTDDVITPMIPHHSYRLRRSNTNVPKLFADSLSEEQQSEPKAPSQHLQNNIQKSFEKAVTFYKSKTRLSLPPIGNDLKSRSLTLGQF